MAAIAGDAPVLAIAFDKGVPVDLRDAEGDTLLCVASAGGANQKEIEWLLKKGADLNGDCGKEDSTKETPLEIASRTGNLEVTAILIKTAIEKGLPLALKAALKNAVVMDHEQVVREILRTNIEVDSLTVQQAAGKCRIFFLLAPRIKDPLDRALTIKHFGAECR